MAQNIKMERKGDVLTITIDLKKEQGPSGSGKSMILASTGGNVDVPGGDGIKIGINAYRPLR